MERGPPSPKTAIFLSLPAFIILEEIKELWKAETDEWVWKAATKNINEYPIEIQAIIKAEAVQRVLSGKNPERPIVTAKNKPKP